MKLINQLHGKITKLNVKGTTWRDLDIATKFHIKFLCELIDERLPAKNTESISAQDAEKRTLSEEYKQADYEAQDQVSRE